MCTILVQCSYAMLWRFKEFAIFLIFKNFLKSQKIIGMDCKLWLARFRIIMNFSAFLCVFFFTLVPSKWWGHLTDGVHKSHYKTFLVPLKLQWNSVFWGFQNLSSPSIRMRVRIFLDNRVVNKMLNLLENLFIHSFVQVC